MQKLFWAAAEAVTDLWRQIPKETVSGACGSGGCAGFVVAILEVSRVMYSDGNSDVLDHLWHYLGFMSGCISQSLIL